MIQIRPPKSSFTKPSQSNRSNNNHRPSFHLYRTAIGNMVTMIQKPGGLGLLLLLVGTRHAMGFSRGFPVVRQQGSRSKLSYGGLSSDAWRPRLKIRGQDKRTLLDDNDEEAAEKQRYDTELFIGAAIPPILALISYGEVSHGFSYLFDVLGFNGSNVDGNAFSTNLLRPTLNGVVVPATGVGLGTLFATTVNVLWNRQLGLRSTINKEVCELRLLRRAIFGCFGTAQHSKRRSVALGLLHGYTQTLISETQIECIERLEDKQKGGGISMNELDELAEMLHGVDGAAASRQGSVSNAEDLLISLNNHRSERVATTLSGFPRIHWFLMNVLYLCIVFSFFVDSNQEVNQYLNSVQLQVLFSIIVSVGSGAAMLLKDLREPFQGSFCINLAAKQLSSIEELLVADIAEAENEQKQLGLPAWMYPDRNRQRPNYDAGNTVYFHLLTGPLGGNIRLLGDLFAWSYRRLTKSWKALRLPRGFRGRRGRPRRFYNR